MLDEHVERVACRWCGASGATIESLDGATLDAEQLHDQPS